MRPAEQIAAFASDVPLSIADFLVAPSSTAWAVAASKDIQTLLIDHGNCELKAASTAMALLHRYPQLDGLVWRMSRLAREELRHYEQVRKLAGELDVTWGSRSAAGYASGLREAVRQNEPERLVDTLIVGAFIEARSCERFALIAPLLPERLARFYQGLLASEARHFEHYLELARDQARDNIDSRIAEIRDLEQELIATPAKEIRFHSGPPAQAIGSVSSI